MEAAEQAKAFWTKCASLKDQGKDYYEISQARDPDAFPAPKWPEHGIGACSSVR